jgi:uncharacterized protein
MKIYVDADASPVKDIVIAVAKNFDIQVVLVKSINHFSNDEKMDGVETVYVDTGADAADYRIMQLAKKGDLIITQDYGLASLGLGKGCLVLHHKGFAYTDQNIDQLLETRHLSAKLRRSGQKTKGPKPFTDEDRNKFRSLLEQVVREKVEEDLL